MKKHGRGWWLLYGGLACLSVFLFLAIVPIVPYHPNCGGIKEDNYLKGPLRPEYQIQLEEFMNDEGIFYWKINNQIYVRYITLFDGENTFRGYDFYNNFEWRAVKSIFYGMEMSGKRVDPPKFLVDIVNLKEEIYNLIYRSYGFSGRNPSVFSDCDVLRAGAIQVENLDVQTP